jgi:tetratricopeptide (TPR) repeat protein
MLRQSGCRMAACLVAGCGLAWGTSRLFAPENAVSGPSLAARSAASVLDLCQPPGEMVDDASRQAFSRSGSEAAVGLGGRAAERILKTFETASSRAILADESGRAADAHEWFCRAAQAAGEASDYELRLVFNAAAAAVAPDRRTFMDAVTAAFAGLPLMSAALVIDPGAPDAPDHSASLRALRTLVFPARSEFETERSLDNKIKLLTALILFGEIASRPEEQLYADANEAFNEGLTLLADVEQELRDDPEKDRRLSEIRPLAVRFDVVRFRKKKIQEKSAQSLKADRDRTRKLQTLVVAYRDMAGEFASAMSSHLSSDGPASLSRIDKAMTKYEEISEVVDAERDYYLMTEEPAPLGGKDPDQELVYNRVSMFTPLFASESLVLRGLSRFRTPPPAGEGLTDDTLVAALADVNKGISAADAGDPENVLGNYAAGVMREARGDLLLEPDPANGAKRDAAAKEFAAARDFLRKAAARAKGVLSEDVASRLAILDEPQAAIERASKETQRGDVAAASRTLDAAMRRHATSLVWARWAAAAARAGRDKRSIRRTLERASAGGVIDGGDPIFVVATGRAIVDDVIARTAGPLESLDVKTRQATATELATAAGMLRAAAAALKDGSKAECVAFQSLALAYRGILLKGIDDEAEVGAAEAYASSKAAHESLTRILAAADVGNRADLQEALVACRLALGYISTATVPAFQDDAIAAFSGVLDEQSRAPGDRANLKLLGAPLVAALRDRPVDAGKESVNYEQRLRRSMVSLLDGTVSLQFGAPDDSARFLEQGLQRLRSRAADTDARPDALSLFNDSDTFEVERYLEDFMNVFAVLADIEAGRPADGLEKAIRRVDPFVLEDKKDVALQDLIAAEILQRVLSRTKSPMALYAVGRAVEAYALSLELSEGAKATADKLLAVGRKAIAEAKAATTPWLASRYPAFVSLLGQSESRMAGPDAFLEQARQLRGQGRLDEAVAELQKAVRLYRDNRELWRLWVEVELTRAVATDEGAQEQAVRSQALEKLRTVIANGQANGAFTDADELYFRGVVDDRLGNAAEAVRLYSRAVGEENLDKVYRVRAKARLAVLKS